MAHYYRKKMSSEISKILKYSSKQVLNDGLSQLSIDVRLFVEKEMKIPSSVVNEIVKNLCNTDNFAMDENDDGDNADLDPEKRRATIEKLANDLAWKLTLEYKKEKDELKERLETERKSKEELKEELLKEKLLHEHERLLRQHEKNQYEKEKNQHEKEKNEYEKEIQRLTYLLQQKQ